MKDNWNAKSILSDLAKLRRIDAHSALEERDPHEYYELLFIHTHTFDSEYDIRTRIAEQTRKSLAILANNVSDYFIVGTCTLLDNVKNPSDQGARTSFVAILVRLYFASELDNPESEERI